MDTLEELPYETKEFKILETTEAGEFQGYASVYGVKDLVDDIVVKGAFNRTLSQHGNQITLLWSTRVRSLSGSPSYRKERKDSRSKVSST
jgi:phage head maturation protease